VSVQKDEHFLQKAPLLRLQCKTRQMIIVSNPTPARLQRFFANWTRLMVQIRNGNILTIAHDQGEAQASINGGADGLQYTLATTAPPAFFWWKGELWHAANNLATQWCLILVGSAEDDSNPATGCGSSGGGVIKKHGTL
jgi:hypothetical protein